MSSSSRRIIVKQPNKDVVLDIIRRSPEGISRAEIAEALAVSRATVSGIVDRLIASGIVLERGAGISRGGRRPIVLKINPEAGHVLGIDLGATHLLVVVSDLSGRVIAESEKHLDIGEGPEVCFEQIEEVVAGLLEQRALKWEQIWAVGMGVPGPVITAHGMVSFPPIMPGWDRFPIRQRLEALWHKPAFVDNDADLGALGEGTFGAGRGESNLAYIKIGTGIGCGILLDGKIYHGVLGTAGEIGHVTISPDGPPCKCGNYGCLEAMAGGRAIAQRAQLAVAAGQPTMLTHRNHERPLTDQDVVQAARAGDPLSQQLLSDAGRLIGTALASLINLLNPGLIIIGGRMATAEDLLLGPIREAVQQRSLRASFQAARIVPAALGRRTIALGAAALAIENGLQLALYQSHSPQRVGAVEPV